MVLTEIQMQREVGLGIFWCILGQGCSASCCFEVLGVGCQGTTTPLPVPEHNISSPQKAKLRFWLKEHVVCDIWLVNHWLLSYFPALSLLPPPQLDCLSTDCNI